MTPRRARRLLFVAFTFSLIVHLFLAGVIRWPFVAQRAEPQIVSIEKRLRVIHIARVVHQVQKPKAEHAIHRINTPQVSKSGHAPSVAVAATTPPTPAPTAGANRCAKPNASAAIAANPAPADISADVRAAAHSGIAQVRVRLDASGAVTGTDVVQSTGDSGLDAVALGLAKSATYAPAYSGCKPIPGSYTFKVQFVAW